MSEFEVFFNPSCTKCRTVRGMLEEKGLEADFIHYLETTPTREELVRVMGLLGLDDPRGMMRTKEPIYTELGLASVNGDELIDAMLANPILIERPIVIRGDRAVIARPAEKALELFSDE